MGRQGCCQPFIYQVLNLLGQSMNVDEATCIMQLQVIAGSLSISAMALYNHVPGKAELMSVMVDDLAREMHKPTIGD